MGVIIGFKCHKCRERAPPVCPHQKEILESGVMCDEEKESFVTDNIVNGLNTGIGDSMEGVVQEDGIAK